MIAVKCVYANGKVINTSINGTIESARKYFVGQLFNLGGMSGYWDESGEWVETEIDDMQKCISCDLICFNCDNPCESGIAADKETGSPCCGKC